jgi:hypothetical protein
MLIVAAASWATVCGRFTGSSHPRDDRVANPIAGAPAGARDAAGQNNFPSAIARPAPPNSPATQCAGRDTQYGEKMGIVLDGKAPWR